MGREQNAILTRRVLDSIFRAQEKDRASKILITDLEDSPLTLVEVISDSGQVIAEFFVEPKKRPSVLRYRDTGPWPE